MKCFFNSRIYDVDRFSNKYLQWRNGKSISSYISSHVKTQETQSVFLTDSFERSRKER